MTQSIHSGEGLRVVRYHGPKVNEGANTPHPFSP